jgi:hypothetical protein
MCFAFSPARDLDFEKTGRSRAKLMLWDLNRVWKGEKKSNPTI